MRCHVDGMGSHSSIAVVVVVVAVAVVVVVVVVVAAAAAAVHLHGTSYKLLFLRMRKGNTNNISSYIIRNIEEAVLRPHYSLWPSFRPRPIFLLSNNTYNYFSVFFLVVLFSDKPEVFLPKYSQTAILHAAYFRRVVNTCTFISGFLFPKSVYMSCSCN